MLALFAQKIQPRPSEKCPEKRAELDALVARRRLVFIDETGLRTNLVRHYGRARRGQRLVDRTPHGHWKTTTLVAALRQEGLTAPMVVDGPMNGELFLAYTQQVLGPTLRPGDIVVLDNLSSHKIVGVRQAIESVGAKLFYLPPYSPDFNPLRWSTPNSNGWSAVRANAPSKECGRSSATSSTDFLPTNAYATFAIVATPSHLRERRSSPNSRA